MRAEQLSRPGPIADRPLRSAEGAVEGGVVTLIDITTQKRLQDQLEDVQGVLDSAERIAAAGETAKRRAQQLFALSVAVFAASVIVLLLRRSRRDTQN